MKGIYKIDLGLISLTVQTKVSKARSGVPNFQDRNWRGGYSEKILNYKDKSDTQGMSGNQTKTGIIMHCTNSCYVYIWNIQF